MINALKYGVYADNVFNINNYQIEYRYLRVETKRSWGSLNINGGYWNMLRVSLNQVDNGYNINTSNVSVLTIKNRCDA